ncbi:MAG: diguanylate cyclase (GGDEF)-like protein [Cellvibrionaceae bacterium]|jgi:diguanylate cyclase (GGDEF)-like protein
MSKNGRILVVEDDFDIADMLRIFFVGQDFEVDVASRGSEALTACRRQLPDLIVLDIMLPDMDGYAVCRELRTTTRTRHIPIIFLTQRDERSDRIAGLELGADDYITKPFDIEELILRVRRAITTYKHNNMTDPRTGLPSGRLIEEELLQLMRSNERWSLTLIGIDNLKDFSDAYGFVAGDEVLRFTAMLINDEVDQHGSLDDFVGHTGGDTFVLISRSVEPNDLIDKIRAHFNSSISAHYNFMDIDRGGIERADGSLAALMKLSAGIVSTTTHTFSDIREVTELAADMRRQDQQSHPV